LAETLEKSVGAREGHLRANALIEGDAHQNRGWILAQESVRSRIAGGQAELIIPGNHSCKTPVNGFGHLCGC